MMLLIELTTELSEQEQKRNASSSSASISTADVVADNPVPATQTGSATSKIDWGAIVRHLSGNSQLAQFAPTLPPASSAKPEYVRVLVEVTDPNQENRKLVECYLQTAAHYGVNSQEASEAFRPIAEKFLPHILRRLQVARKYNLQLEDAEDIAQEVFFSTWNWLNSYLSSNSSSETGDAKQEQGEGQEQKKELNNLWQLLTIIVRNCAANWMQHQYRARSRVKKQSSAEGDAVTNPLRFVSLHHVPSQILTSRIRNFGRELELSSSNYSKAARSCDLTSQLYDASTDVEAVVEQREALRELTQAISEMGRTKPHYRLVLLEHVKGRSYQQIAAENDWTTEQVKKYLYRARRWLANYFATTAAAATVAGNEGKTEKDKEKEKESTVASGSVPRAERERKKVKKSKPSSTRTEDWQVAAD